MLIVLQFPICDVRRFVESESGLLTRPNWWLAEADKDFVRSFGAIRKRRQGGLNNWIGEHKICIAANALRFEKTEESTDFFRQPGWKIAFRTLFFDGCCVGKFEVGISCVADASGAVHVKETLRQFLNLPARVPTGVDGKYVACKLADAGKPLATLFRRVSTDQKWPNKDAVPDWWVTAQSPVLLIEQRPSEAVAINLNPDKSFPAREDVPAIDRYITTRQGRYFGVWAYGESESGAGRQEARRLRIALLRIHAEREILVNVLRLAADRRLNVAVAGEAGADVAPARSDSGTDIDDPSAQRNCKDLQAYLNAATRRIGKLERHTGVPIEALANELDDAVNQGEREAIRAAIDSIRPTVKRKVDTLLSRSPQQRASQQDKLTGAQIDQLRAALLDAFDPASLTQMVKIRLDEDLYAIVKDRPLNEVVFDLIRWAMRIGRVGDLVAGACSERPHNSTVQEVAKALGMPCAPPDVPDNGSH